MVPKVTQDEVREAAEKEGTCYSGRLTRLYLLAKFRLTTYHTQPQNEADVLIERHAGLSSPRQVS